MPSPAVAHVLRYKVPAAAAVSYSTEASTLFAAMTSSPDATRKGLIDDCIVGLKADSVWASLDWFWLTAGNEHDSLLNWIAPTTTMTNTNACAFTTDQGFTGGSTKLLDTGFSPTTAPSPKFTQNSNSAAAWTNTTGQIAGASFGATGGTGKNNIFPRFTDDKSYYRESDNVGINVSNTDGKGLFASDRSTALAIAGYKNGASVVTSGASASMAQENFNFTFLTDSTFYYTGAILGGSFGQSLGATLQAALYSRMHTYLQAVSGVA